MLRILVPTDFSEQSYIAVNYAVALTGVLDADLYLLNVAYIKGPHHVSITGEFEQELLEKAEGQLDILKEEIIRKNPGLKVEAFEAEGYPVHEFIHLVAQKNNIDLIIMPAGASAGTRSFLGSTTTNVLENIPCPVIIVPKDYLFNGFKNILYASDLKKEEDEIPLVIDFVKLFNAKLQVIHVLDKNKIKITDIEKTASLRDKYGYKDLTFSILKSEDKATEIRRYASDHKIDLIMVFIHNRSIFENLFQYSVTKELSYISEVPLLVFKKPGE